MARRKKTSPYENTIKGRIFEFVLRDLIKKAGFNLDVDIDQLVKSKKKRLRGRGSTYDPDFIGEFPIIIPFSYPFLLVGEAKYHKKIIEVKTAREFLGSFIDISQFSRIDTKSKMFKYSQIFHNKRYNYIPVIFSKSGFRRNAQALMWTHGIYFISYENSPIFDEINKKIDAVLKKIDYSSLDKDDIKKLDTLESFKSIKDNARKEGYGISIDNLINLLNPIKSYLGILDRLWPVHFLYKAKSELKPSLKTRESKVIIEDNKVIVKRTLHKNSQNLGFFTLPKYFLEEYKKIAEKKKTKFMEELLLYINKENKVYPYYINLKQIGNKKEVVKNAWMFYN